MSNLQPDDNDTDKIFLSEYSKTGSPELLREFVKNSNPNSVIRTILKLKNPLVPIHLVIHEKLATPKGQDLICCQHPETVFFLVQVFDNGENLSNIEWVGDNLLVHHLKGWCPLGNSKIAFMIKSPEYRMIAAILAAPKTEFKIDWGTLDRWYKGSKDDKNILSLFAQYQCNIHSARKFCEAIFNPMQ